MPRAGILLLPIAEALARFVCTEDFSNVKACEGHTCTLIFADRTWSRAEVVQHGCLRQSREAGYTSEPAESRSLKAEFLDVDAARERPDDVAA